MKRMITYLWGALVLMFLCSIMISVSDIRDVTRIMVFDQLKGQGVPPIAPDIINNYDSLMIKDYDSIMTHYGMAVAEWSDTITAEKYEKKTHY